MGECGALHKELQSLGPEQMGELSSLTDKVSELLPTNEETPLIEGSTSRAASSSWWSRLCACSFWRAGDTHAAAAVSDHDGGEPSNGRRCVIL
ncbi:MAG: hypothetical protein K0U12_00450 [Gammaproteobacteria bacterium]|nr:hypothetical protein [Gammaproteobacteria bacterium]